MLEYGIKERGFLFYGSLRMRDITDISYDSLLISHVLKLKMIQLLVTDKIIRIQTINI